MLQYTQPERDNLTKKSSNPELNLMRDYEGTVHRTR
jgi:hypothetical protein